MKTERCSEVGNIPNIYANQLQGHSPIQDEVMQMVQHIKWNFRGWSIAVLDNNSQIVKNRIILQLSPFEKISELRDNYIKWKQCDALGYRLKLHEGTPGTVYSATVPIVVSGYNQALVCTNYIFCYVTDVSNFLMSTTISAGKRSLVCGNFPYKPGCFSLSGCYKTSFFFSLLN